MPTHKQVLEALLFASDAPVGLATLVEILDGPSAEEVANLLAELKHEYETTERGVALVEIAGGYQILSRKECAPWIDRMLRTRRKTRLSRAGLETLAIVAYKQPVTRHQITSIRGVNSDGVLRALQDKGLVEEAGREETPGRPALLATTPSFLERLGLPSLAALPSLAPLLGLEAEELGEEPEGDSEEPDSTTPASEPAEPGE